MRLHTVWVIMTLIKWLGFESHLLAPQRSQWSQCEGTTLTKRASFKTWNPLGQQDKFSTYQVTHINSHLTHTTPSQGQHVLSSPGRTGTLLYTPLLTVLFLSYLSPTDLTDILSCELSIAPRCVAATNTFYHSISQTWSVSLQMLSLDPPWLCTTLQQKDILDGNIKYEMILHAAWMKFGANF